MTVNLLANLERKYTTSNYTFLIYIEYSMQQVSIKAC